MVHCYAQRVLNPYRGVRHYIQIDNAEAVTSDGIHWSLYITDPNHQRRVDTNALMSGHTTTIKYGNWSRAGELERAPPLGWVDYQALEPIGQQLLDTVIQYEPALPFAFTDEYELWIVDEDYQPIVLIHSQHQAPSNQQSTMKRWTSGDACHQHFPNFTLCQNLEQAVKKHAHSFHALQWYRRSEGGLVPLAADVPVPAATPACLLREDWGDDELDRLSRDYLAWQAPYLLMLDSIPLRRRADLERDAGIQAGLIASLYRLYPVVSDPAWLNHIRVQARLQLG